MSDHLHNKVVLITGASSGIGALMARAVAAEGGIPAMLARSSEKLAELEQELPGAMAIVGDVTSMEQVDNAVMQVIEQYGRIDVLINNAGYGIFERLLDTELTSIENMMNVNYMGVVRCTRAVLPYMLAAGTGQIVNIGSLAGKVGSAKSSAYAATKHAVLGFTNSMRQELYGTGIQMTAINPGPIDTPFFEKADPTGQYVNNVRWMMLKAEKVCVEVMKAIRKRKAEVNMPFVANASAKIYLLFPRLFEKIAVKLLSKK